MGLGAGGDGDGTWGFIRDGSGATALTHPTLRVAPSEGGVPVIPPTTSLYPSVPPAPGFDSAKGASPMHYPGTCSLFPAVQFSY